MNQNKIEHLINQNTRSTIEHQIREKKQTVHIVVRKNSMCVLKSIDNKTINSVDVEFYIELEQNAQINIQLLLLHSKLINCNITIHLKGDRSKADITGLYVLDSDQKVVINSVQHHEGRYSTSNLVMKGMLKGNAQASYQGLIKIEKGAAGTDASQTNKNIVLSKTAKVISVPTIEVLQHDVQCCHGSAIGKFDKDQLWYLQIKGLHQDVAQKLLIQSFFGDVLKYVDNVEKIMDELCQKMI